MSDHKVLPFVPKPEHDKLADAQAFMETTDEEPVRVGEVMAVAEAIESPEQYASLLATARTPEERAAWDLALSPYLKFNLHPCHTPDCASGLKAVFQPILIVKHTWMSRPLYAPLDVRYCGKCALTIRIAEVLDDALWANILASCAVAGELLPDRTLTELKFTKP